MAAATQPEAAKFTEEEMSTISNIQESYLKIQNNLGQISVQKIRTEQQLNQIVDSEETLTSQFREVQTKERQFVDSINGKYGDGNLDLATGVFTPKPAEETTKKTDKTL